MNHDAYADRLADYNARSPRTVRVLVKLIPAVDEQLENKGYNREERGILFKGLLADASYIEQMSDTTEAPFDARQIADSLLKSPLYDFVKTRREKREEREAPDPYLGLTPAQKLTAARRVGGKK